MGLLYKKHPRLSQDQGSNLPDLRYNTRILLRVSQLAIFLSNLPMTKAWALILRAGER